MKTIYEIKGYKNREEYLKSLVEKYPNSFVYELAGLLGQGEDFFELISALEKY